MVKSLLSSGGVQRPLLSVTYHSTLFLVFWHAPQTKGLFISLKQGTCWRRDRQNPVTRKATSSTSPRFQNWLALSGVSLSSGLTQRKLLRTIYEQSCTKATCMLLPRRDGTWKSQSRKQGATWLTTRDCSYWTRNTKIEFEKCWVRRPSITWI